MATQIESVRCSPSKMPSGSTSRVRVDHSFDAPDAVDVSVPAGFTVAPTRVQVAAAGPTVFDVTIDGAGECRLRCDLGGRFRTTIVEIT
jgi:hypothetical protein